MKPRKPRIPSNTAVWRISDSAPRGEWVGKSESLPAPKTPDLPEVTHGSWVTSSFDLLSGSEITEVSDTLPGELFDELFAPSSTGTPKNTDK